MVMRHGDEDHAELSGRLLAMIQERLPDFVTWTGDLREPDGEVLWTMVLANLAEWLHMHPDALDSGRSDGEALITVLDLLASASDDRTALAAMSSFAEQVECYPQLRSRILSDPRVSESIRANLELQQEMADLGGIDKARAAELLAEYEDLVAHGTASEVARATARRDLLRSMLRHWR
jgi:hypothetical protein